MCHAYRELLASHEDGVRQHLSEDGHGVGDVDNLANTTHRQPFSWTHNSSGQHTSNQADATYTAVLADLGDKVAGAQVVRDGHAHTQHEDVVVGLLQLLHQALGVGVEGAGKVGLILLRERLAAHGVLLVVRVDAASGVVGDVDLALVAKVQQTHCANHVHAVNNETMKQPRSVCARANGEWWFRTEAPPPCGPHTSRRWGGQSGVWWVCAKHVVQTSGECGWSSNTTAFW